MNAAAVRAVGDGVVGPLPPVLEEELAAELRRLMPWVEQVRFLKTGAEAMAAAVRLARTATGREAVLGLRLPRLARLVPGPGRPRRAGRDRALYAELPFNDAGAHPRADPPRGRHAGRGGVRAGHPRAARSRSGSPCCARRPTGSGAVLIADEIKTDRPAGDGRRRASASASGPIWW